jgi:hypothetical protein
MALSDLTYTNDYCEVVLDKAPAASSTTLQLGGEISTAGLNSTLTETPYGSPTVEWDFKKGVLPSGLTFTRNSEAYYYDSGGFLKNAVANEPRFIYDQLTRKSLGLLIENSDTRGIANPTDFGFDSTGGITLSNTGSSIINPLGVTSSLNGVKNFSLNTGTNSLHYGFFSISISRARANFSIYAKRSTTNTVYPVLILDNGVANGIWASFNLNTGTILQTGVNGAGNSQNATIEKFRNGWYRIGISGAGGANYVRASVTATNTTSGSQWYPSYVAVAGDNFNLWGPTVGGADASRSTNTSFIQVSGAGRDTDRLRTTGTTWSNYHNASEGTYYFEWYTPPQYAASDSNFYYSSFNQVGCSLFRLINEISFEQIIFNVLTNATTGQLSVTSSPLGVFSSVNTTLRKGLNKIAISYRGGEISLAVNGTGAGTILFQNEGRLGITAVNFDGGSASTTSYILSNFKYYPRRFEDSTLISMTIPSEY